ncbi:unnamed protein product [Rotaria magnacalcarata]
MSSINYNNQMPLQDPNAPPRMRRYRRGGVLGANQYNNNGANQYNNNGANQYNNNGANPPSNYGGNPSNYGRNQYYSNRGNQYYSNRGNQYYSNRRNQYNNYRRNQYNRPNYYPQNVYYNRNYRPPQQSYSFESRPQGGRFSRPVRSRRSGSNQQRRSRSNRPNSRDNRPMNQRRRGPRQMRLNDFMPPEIREPSPNLPPDFNLETTTTTTTTAPPDALPQRERFATTRNTTQPFVVNQDNQQPQQRQQQNQRQRRITSSYRRQQGRNNRFAVLADENEDEENNIEMDIKDEPMPFKAYNKKKKTRLYLESNRIFKWLENHSKNSKNAASGRGNQAYVLAATSIYDDWVRNNYELQVWQAYLKLATEKKHWAKEVVQRTKRRDDVLNTRFVQKKINQLTSNISEASAAISDLQIQLSTYWMQTTSEITNQRLAQATTKNILLERTRQATTTAAAAATTTDTDDEISTKAPTTTTAKNYAREPVDRIEKFILEYIKSCTQHVQKMAQIRIQLAKAQMEEFKALEDFEQVIQAQSLNFSK